MDKKVKYGTKKYAEAYNKGQIVNSYNPETDTYETTLPEVTITPRNNLNLAEVVRRGNSKVAKPAIRLAQTVLDFTPLSPAQTAGRLIGAASKYKRTGEYTEELDNEIGSTLLEGLPFFLKPIKFTDPLIKKVIRNAKGEVEKIILTTKGKGEVASIELSPSEYNDFGKKWLHPEYIEVKPSERGKGLSEVLYAEGIKEAKKTGNAGILSGEVLLQPEKTVKTQRKFNGPEMDNPVEEYNYPIKGMESPKDKNLSKKKQLEYVTNSNNTFTSTLFPEIYNQLWFLLKGNIPAVPAIN